MSGVARTSIGDGREPAPTRRIRICFLIGTLDRGGAEGQLVQLATRLPRDRFETLVCCLTDAGAHRRRLEEAGIHVEALGKRPSRSSARPFSAAWRVVRLVRLIHAYRPDIVHGFLFWAYVLGAGAAWVNRVPVVVASRRSLGRFKASRPVWRLLDRLANSVTTHIVANSDAVRQDVIETERLAPAKVSVIYNGVEFVEHAREPSRELAASVDAAGREGVLAVVANLIYYKGHDYFIDALPTILAAFPGAVALFIGDGPMRVSLEAHAEARGVARTIRWLGERPDVAALLSLADIVVHPATEEGFSNAILEAMACSKPVVAARVGGNGEQVVDGVTGRLVRERDPSALAEAVVWLLGHPAEARAMGAAGRERVQRLFSVDRMVREYDTLYTSLLRACGR